MGDATVKDDIINATYNHEHGFGSRVDTFKRAHAQQADITMKDVARWYEANIENKKRDAGFNSFVAHRPKEEYQVDLMFLKNKIVPKKVIKKHQKKKGEDGVAPIEDVEKTEYDPLPESDKPLMVLCDIFTRRIWIVPMENSDRHTIQAALQEGFEHMGGKPEILYSDQEGGLRSNEAQKWLRDNNVKMIFTRHHAAFVERQIRTVKDTMLKRIEKWATRDPPNWGLWRSKPFLKQICDIRNNERENATTQLKPVDAERAENHTKLVTRLELERKSNRPLERINVDDYVQYYGQKKKPFSKEFESVWAKPVTKITEIVKVGEQNLYRLENQPTELYVRAELRKVPAPH